jgi:hypothetical protein
MPFQGLSIHIEQETRSINTLKVRKFTLLVADHVTCMKEMRNAYNVLVGEAEKGRPLGRNTRRWQYNIIMLLKLTGCKDVD